MACSWKVAGPSETSLALVADLAFVRRRDHVTLLQNDGTALARGLNMVKATSCAGRGPNLDGSCHHFVPRSLARSDGTPVACGWNVARQHERSTLVADLTYREPSQEEATRACSRARAKAWPSAEG